MAFDRYTTEYLPIDRPDEAIPAIFDNEIYNFHRGFLLGIFGNAKIKTGGGKTWTAASIGWDYDEKFNADWVVLDPSSLLLKFEEIERRKEKGRVVVFEETQTQASNRTWWSLYNRVVLQAIETFRHIQCVAIFVSPMANLIDKDIRKLMRFTGENYLYNEDGLTGYLRLRETFTYNEDKDIGHGLIRFYHPPTGEVLALDWLKVYGLERSLMREIDEKVDEAKVKHRDNLRKEVENFEANLDAVYKRRHVFNPRETAEKIFQEPEVVREFGVKNHITSSTVAAIRPDIKSTKDLGAVAFWANSMWEKMKLVGNK